MRCVFQTGAFRLLRVRSCVINIDFIFLYGLFHMACVSFILNLVQDNSFLETEIKCGLLGVSNTKEDKSRSYVALLHINRSCYVTATVQLALEGSQR